MKPKNLIDEDVVYIWESKIKVHDLTGDEGHGDNEIVYEYVVAPTAEIVVEKVKAAWEIPGERTVGFIHTMPKAEIDDDGFVEMYTEWQNNLLP